MGRKRNRNNREFWESNINNNSTYNQYYNRLTEITIGMFEWKNLPKNIDPRYLELSLFSMGQVVLFYDEDLVEPGGDALDGFLALPNMPQGGFNVYGVPNNRQAFGYNGYRKNLTEKDSVIIYNNLLHTNSMLDVRMFSERLYNIERTIDVNINAQKTPVLILCDENERLTMQNLYMQWEGNMPVIYGEKNLNTKGVEVLKTDAPMLAEKLYTLKTQYWNERLTYAGISNVNITKRERLITDEVTRNQGGVAASRYSKLIPRQERCKQANEMFKDYGLNIWCDYREDYQIVENEAIIKDKDDTDSEVLDYE